MTDFEEMETTLLLALALSPNSVKDIASASGIEASTLYKWRTTDVHLSPKKVDTLMNYFIAQEPYTYLLALIVRTALLLLIDYSASLFIMEVAEEEDNNDRLFQTAKRIA